MTTPRLRTHDAAYLNARRDLEDALDPLELADQDDAWLDKLRTEHARRAALDLYDYVELLGF